MPAKTASGITYPAGGDNPRRDSIQTLAETTETALAGKAAAKHTHTQADVTGLADALAAKLPAANIARGSVPLQSLAAGATISGTAKFATALAAPPAVVICSTDQTRVQVAVASPTTTGFNWAASNWTSAAANAGTLFYVAIL